jgi:hypothetical protein
MARKWDSDALNYLRARSRYISSFDVPVGAPYEPEGGVVMGWATASARTDAAQRHQNVVSYLAWSAPPPPTTTAPGPTSEGGVPLPPSPTSGPQPQPLPEVTILGTPDKPNWLLPAAAVVALLVFSK